MSVFENSYTRAYDAMPFQKDQRKIKVLSESVFINSLDGEQIGNGKFRVKLPQEYRNVTSARLLSAEVPHSMYNFSSALDNNRLSLSSGDVTIDPAIYTSQTLIDVIDERTSLSVTFDANSGTCTIVAPVDTTLFLNPLAKQLGFTTTTTLPAGQAVRAPNCVNVHTVPYIFLSIVNLNQSQTTIAETTTGNPQVFAKVWISTRHPFETVYYDKKLSETTLSPPTTLNMIEAQWLTPDLRPVDFNGFPTSFTLELFCTTSQRSL